MLNKITSKLNNLKKDESGASAIEYSVMAALLVIIIVYGISLLGGGEDGTKGIEKAFTNVQTELEK
ncbi:Flp family type IVb pilin [Zhongshania aquimaris]|uniref:Flp family type IVb pilin n=1 Tax=Zhongshania aquimaris TaxID=2857107 RepID=A0ABS6VMF3_9GAMM|nr:Flp family type IVb pilin [Zhongshania aquimaris]MBW2939481.1 Flp family type IVb pilin [Zhongshania aquimaris]